MSVRLDGEVIRLDGDCRVEDAEPLAELLRHGPRPVDLEGCDRLHGAVVQVLLAFGPALRGEPASDFARRHLIPALARAIDLRPEMTTNRP